MKKVSAYNQLSAEVSFLRYDNGLNDIFVCIDISEQNECGAIEEII